MSRLNVLTDFPYRARYYLRKPWRFFKECWWNLQNAWSRATKGYAWVDAADMDSYLLYLIPQLLREIADGGAYPATEEFPDYESWQTWCVMLAETFESVQGPNWEKNHINEYEEEWSTLCDYRHPHPNFTMTCAYDTSEEHFNEVWTHYRDREVEIRADRDRVLQNAYHELAKHHNMLWI